MKILITPLFLVFFFAPTAQTQAEEGIGSLFSNYMTTRPSERLKSERKAARKRNESALKRREYNDDYEEPEYNDPFDDSDDESYFEETKIHKDDRYIKLKTYKSGNQLDTWGRDGGQTVSSKKVLEYMMSPAKKAN